MIDLKKLSALEKAATPAPWYAWKGCGRNEVPHSTDGGIFTISKETCVKKWQERDPSVKNPFPLDEDIVIDCTEYFNMPHQYQTFEFIAEMRNQLPDLIAYIDRLVAEIERLREKADQQAARIAELEADLKQEEHNSEAFMNKLSEQVCYIVDLENQVAALKEIAIQGRVDQICRIPNPSATWSHPEPIVYTEARRQLAEEHPEAFR